jgi:riboflavin synthase
MFTGIIEAVAKVEEIKHNGTNLDLTFSSPITQELKIDQSLAHNGACLTVVHLDRDRYTVTAVQETLEKTNIGDLKKGDLVNIERAMLMNGTLDGHIVQGHVDQVGNCTMVETRDGSWFYTFTYDTNKGNVTIEKGSICINGVSLTVVDSKDGEFSVTIIPYTYEHTGFKNFKIGTRVNLEFDVIGKYVARLLPKD